MLIKPHQTLSSVIASLTLNRSIGDRPVNSPILTANALEEVSNPWLDWRVISCNASADSWYKILQLLIPKENKKGGNTLLLEAIYSDV